MYILGYRDDNDRKYYVAVIVHSTRLQFPFKVNFLVDTGASRTQISWNDADSARIVIRTLPQDSGPYTGVGGSVNGYVLEDSTLIFKSSLGINRIPIGRLSVSDFQTIDGRTCPPSPSLLGIDLLSRFDLLFEDTYIMLRM